MDAAASSGAFDGVNDLCMIHCFAALPPQVDSPKDES